MNKIRIALLALALTLMAIPTVAQAAGLGVAGDYNAFVFGNFTSQWSDTQGRLAVGGNADLNGYSVGDQLPSGTSGDVLVVGGNLKYGDGRVYYGDIRVGGSASMPSYDVQDGDLYTNAAMPFSFADEEAYLKNLSSLLSKLTSTGTAAYVYSTLTLTGTGSDVEVFNLDGSALLDATGLDLSGIANGATIIINVSGTLAGLTNMSLEALFPYQENVIFNFYEATELTLQGVAVRGSVLAPYADVSDATGVIWGTLIAESFDSSIQLNYVPFEGDLPTPIPGAVWLLGTGLLGLVGLRRKFRD